MTPTERALRAARLYALNSWTAARLREWKRVTGSDVIDGSVVVRLCDLAMEGK